LLVSIQTDEPVHGIGGSRAAIAPPVFGQE
jgi:hypothetical protein